MVELVCDTSAIVALHQVHLLDILPKLAASVVVPSAVAQELETGQSQGHDVPDLATIHWLSIRAPQDKSQIVDAVNLGEGESEVLQLAVDSPNAVAVIDELPARRAARQLGIRFTGTLGLLVDAKQRGLIPAVGPVLDELSQQGFHLSSQVRQIVLKAAKE